MKERVLNIKSNRMNGMIIKQKSIKDIYLVIFNILLLISCNSNNVESKSQSIDTLQKDYQENKNDVIKKEDIEICNIDICVKLLNNSGVVDQSLLLSFLKTINQKCRHNVEYNQLANRVLFAYLDKKTEDIVVLIDNYKVYGLDKNEIFYYLNNPIDDSINISNILFKLNQLPMTLTSNEIKHILTEKMSDE